jgi:hypothetical protein
MHEADPPWKSRERRAQDMMKKTNFGEPRPAPLDTQISCVSLNGLTKEGQRAKSDRSQANAQAKTRTAFSD